MPRVLSLPTCRVLFVGLLLPLREKLALGSRFYAQPTDMTASNMSGYASSNGKACDASYFTSLSDLGAASQ